MDLSHGHNTVELADYNEQANPGDNGPVPLLQNNDSMDLATESQLPLESDFGEGYLTFDLKDEPIDPFSDRSFEDLYDSSNAINGIEDALVGLNSQFEGQDPLQDWQFDALQPNFQGNEDNVLERKMSYCSRPEGLGVGILDILSGPQNGAIDSYMEFRAQSSPKIQTLSNFSAGLPFVEIEGGKPRFFSHIRHLSAPSLDPQQDPLKLAARDASNTHS